MQANKNRHLQRKHMEEEEAASALSLPTTQE